MEDEEFDEFVEQSVEELDQKQEMLTDQFGLGTWSDFWFDATQSRLQFKDDTGRVQVEADIMIIGTFSENSNTWQWAWANKSLPDPIRKQSRELQKLEKVTGVEVFTSPTIDVDDAMTWELTAMSVRHLSALGCYSMPNGPITIFLAIIKIWRTEAK